MSRSQPVPPDQARRFRTGRRCLDFAHTGGDGPWEVFELLHNIDDAARWLAVVLDVDVEVTADEGVRLEDVVALRRAIWNGATALAASRPIQHPDRVVINRAAQAPSTIPELSSNGQASVAQPVSLRQALSTLARDAIDLLGGPLAQRIRVCAAQDCGLLLVDQSRPGKRRWCSMQRCGNLNKLRRYRDRSETASKP